MTAYHCSGVILWNTPSLVMPALLTRTSTGPRSLATCASPPEQALLEAADVPLVGLHAGFSLELRRRFVISGIGRRDLVSGGLQRLGIAAPIPRAPPVTTCASAGVSSPEKDVGGGTTLVPLTQYGDRA